ncbi:hypothetical protein GCM10007890_48160 [Methylobacterium tardum]|uniref:Uncharacterized protein n=1 Tax=Methylobacterium tardum TaxID=374432 RepID=A0AA37TFB7_9HYPH|nr:hypothetical protein GCM10007890_48160 [Methylobacterium tardum]
MKKQEPRASASHAWGMVGPRARPLLRRRQTAQPCSGRFRGGAGIPGDGRILRGMALQVAAEPRQGNSHTPSVPAISGPVGWRIPSSARASGRAPSRS